jgi:hypothetical protein
MEIEISVDKNSDLYPYTFIFNKRMNLVYGLNNSGKTYLMEHIFNVYCSKYTLKKAKSLHSIFLPISRIETKKIELSYYKIESRDNQSYWEVIKDTSSDIKNRFFRDTLLVNDAIHKFIQEEVNYLFTSEIDVKTENNISDGIKNIVNILLSIIYSLVWDNPNGVVNLGKDELKRIVKRKCFVVIDEVESYIHLSVQDKLLNRLSKTFPNVIFVFSTHSALLLSRYKNMNIYYIMENSGDQIRRRKIQIIDSNELFYKSMETIMIDYFHVEKYPQNAAKFIDYFSDVMNNKNQYNKGKYTKMKKDFEIELPNIFIDYKFLIDKVEFINETK